MTAEAYPVLSSVLLCGERADLWDTTSLTRRTLIFGLDHWSYPRGLKWGRLVVPGNAAKQKSSRKQALEFLTQGAWRLIVLFGSKASRVFGHEGPFFTHALDFAFARVPVVSLPPPLSRREWRGPLVDRARDLLRKASPDLPWGVLDDPLARVSFAFRLAAEAALWMEVLPVELRDKSKWDSTDHMVALDGFEHRGLPRVSAELLIARCREIVTPEEAAA